ncbi:MAG: MBOAT family protein [Candidatus Hydrogenedentes bacterium]|nr:MBOAT family protein [Candidatus Hydrogenedentota bacterium]
MLFNSFVFLLFLLIVLPLYYALPHRYQNRMLLVASYIFYGWWDWRFLSLLAISTLVDYSLGLLLGGAANQRTRRCLLAASLVVNLGMLAVFKYFNFFIDSAAAFLEFAGLNANVPLLTVVLPVGISFYTFQSLAYVIDVYRGTQQPARSLVDFALYVSYFPQLVAGPIERASRLLPQLQKQRVVTRDQWNSGLALMLCGYVKKVAIADAIAPYADPVFSHPHVYSSAALWVAMYSFAIQIYCDFSGYTDIARGVSRLMGIELMENFRQPYLAPTITDFWRRWHISLSEWLRDYLYIPLGGSRHGTARQYRNLMVTMLLGGLWHGASWNYVLWGGLHGVYLTIHKIIAGKTPRETTVPHFPSLASIGSAWRILVTFHLVSFAWILFRCADLTTALDYLGGLAPALLDVEGSGKLLPGASAMLIYCAFVVIGLDMAFQWSRRSIIFARMPWWSWGILCAAGTLAISYSRGDSGEAFIYFQF